MLNFSEWMRNNLLKSWEGLITQDIDYLIFNNNLESFILIEEKNSEKARVNIAQAIIFKFLDEFLSLQKDVQFYGSFLVYALQNGIYINPNLKRIKNSWSYGVDKLNEKIDLNKFKSFVCSNQNQLQQYYYKWWITIVNELVNKLYNCEGNSPNFTTRQERSGYRGTRLYNLCKNMKKIDWIFVNYCTGYFILLEEKTLSNGNYQPATYEKNLIQKIDTIFNNSNNINLNMQCVKNPRSQKLYEYLGYFLIEFDKNTPDDSNKIWLNHKLISKNECINFLNLNSNNSKNIANSYKTNWWQ